MGAERGTVVFYLAYSYEGPMVYVDAGSRWMVISPGGRLRW